MTLALPAPVERTLDVGAPLPRGPFPAATEREEPAAAGPGAGRRPAPDGREADVLAACCEAGLLARSIDEADIADPAAYVRALPDGGASLSLVVEGVDCAACVPEIERALAAVPGVTWARLNLTTRRLSVAWRPERVAARDLLVVLARLGYRAVPYDAERLARIAGEEERALLRALAVAGFAAGNVMLLSVAIWAGLAQDMGPATRALMHWLSALIALPAVAYAGRPFFRSAAAALRAGRVNMDVPITLGVLLASAMSLLETTRGGEEAYFDAAVTLLFFLLVGRYLDRLLRGRAESAAANLAALAAVPATVVEPDGTRHSLPAEQVAVGALVEIRPGDRVPVDGRVAAGLSELDQSLLTGETLPVAVAPGSRVAAGTLNLSGLLTVEATAVGEGTVLAEIVHLMDAAEQGRARHVRLADRVARLYAPVVHLAALGAFLWWWGVAGLAWQPALLIAVAVLIVTCPCALALAVPAVQVGAVGRLLRKGVLVKAADALERLAEVDTIVFDKTGTLTLGRPELANADSVSPDDLAFAARLAVASRHPLARAVARAAGGDAQPLDGVVETPGLGLAARLAAGEARLGSAAWCGVPASEEADGASELWLARPGRPPARLAFRDRLRPDAAEVVRSLGAAGCRVMLLSGDRAAAVAPVAASLGIAEWRAACRPADKIGALEALARDGRKTLMVGDGLNDAPALAAAFASLSPGTAADVSRTAADVVVQGDSLAPLLETLAVARRARRLVLGNFAIAFGYNVVAVPLALAALVTPLVAAALMSASSLAVTANALRIRLGGTRP